MMLSWTWFFCCHCLLLLWQSETLNFRSSTFFHFAVNCRNVIVTGTLCKAPVFWTFLWLIVVMQTQIDRRLVWSKCQPPVPIKLWPVLEGPQQARSCLITLSKFFFPLFLWPLCDRLDEVCGWWRLHHREPWKGHEQQHLDRAYRSLELLAVVIHSVMGCSLPTSVVFGPSFLARTFFGPFSQAWWVQTGFQWDATDFGRRSQCITNRSETFGG